MRRLWGCLAGILVYLELLYHVSGFGMWRSNPLFTIGTLLAWSLAGVLLVGVVRGKGKTVLFYLLLSLAVVWTGAQTVYLHIFKQPLLWEAIISGGQDALTNYWREALEGVWQVSPYLVLMILPIPVVAVLSRKKKWTLPTLSGRELAKTAGLFGVAVLGSVLTLQAYKLWQKEAYESYQEFYDPLTIAEDMGVLPMFQRDSVMGLQNTLAKWSKTEKSKKPEKTAVPAATPGGGEDRPALPEKAPIQTASGGQSDMQEAYGGEGNSDRQSDSPDGDTHVPLQAGELLNEAQETPEETKDESQTVRKAYQELAIDWEKLRELSEGKNRTWLAQYIEETPPTETNEYTGRFAGYNLIFLTAEGFSPYAVREDLTPTLYRLIHSGFVFDNYYVPLWQTSTSDGEYINCTGLIPDRQFSMRKSAQNNMAFTLPRFFGDDAVCLAYHNNSIYYYDRYLTHNNLGYFFKGNALGGLRESEWGDHVFSMEHPKEWPASDLEMMQATVGEYVEQERFLVYYMTVSGHMNYNFRGNAMSGKNKEAVRELELSENGQAYIACNIELDKALQYLLEELEKAGKLETTVICLSADHYPYAMTAEQYEELAGHALSEGMERFRNNLILWNASMEQEPVTVKKACGSMDLLPTLLNLFGFDFDSRLYAGRDIFAPQEGLVIFNDRSFVTDSCICRKRERQLIWLTDENGDYLVPEEERKAYLARIEEEVKNRYQFSAWMLQENYYDAVKQALAE